MRDAIKKAFFESHRVFMAVDSALKAEVTKYSLTNLGHSYYFLVENNFDSFRFCQLSHRLDFSELQKLFMWNFGSFNPCYDLDVCGFNTDSLQF